MKPLIYLDNNAATFACPQVAEAIFTYLKQPIGNPSSVHAFGRKGRALLSSARAAIASALGVKSQEIVFSSCGTEVLNFCILGFLKDRSYRHIITSDVEHAAVFETIKGLEKTGYSVTYLPAGIYGAPTPEQLRAAIRPDTGLIALMAVNNETGVITDISAMGQIAALADIPFVVDGVALLGKKQFVIPKGVAAICFSGQKIHGPQGIGFAYLKSGSRLSPLIRGGNQEMGLRGGSENMPGIIGLKIAFESMQQNLSEAIERMTYLRDLLEERLLALGGVSINGRGSRVCNTSSLCFSGVDGESLLSLLDMSGVAVSHGSACSSGTLEPSRILLNMGLPIEKARSSLRFSLSRFTTLEEIETAIEIVSSLVHRFRGSWQTSKR